MEHILLDIETIACKQVISNTALIDLAKQKIIDKEYNPRWKPETIAEARAKDLEAVEASTIDKMALKPAQAQVCCIVARQWDPDPQMPTIELAGASPDEQALLLSLADFLHDLPLGEVTFIGFNIKDFDIPILAAAYMRNKMSIPRALHAALLKPYSSIDLFKMFPNCGPMAIFSECLGLGIEDLTSGADVASLAAQEEWKAILDHCVADVAKLEVCFDRIML